MKVIGTYVSSFTDKKTGEIVVFARLSVVCPANKDEKGIEGEVVEAIRVKPEVMVQAPVGSGVQPYYDKYDNIHAFDVVSPTE